MGAWTYGMGMVAAGPENRTNDTSGSQVTSSGASGGVAVTKQSGTGPKSDPGCTGVTAHAEHSGVGSNLTGHVAPFASFKLKSPGSAR